MQIIKPDGPYIISTNTLVLQSTHKENRTKTFIMENDKNFVHPRKPFHILKASCHHYGTSFKVAERNAKSILNNRKKPPVVVAYDHGVPLIMMPTSSARSEQNIWIAFHAVAGITVDNMNRTIITLINNQKIIINVSETTIHRQISLSMMLSRHYQKKFSHFTRPWIPGSF